MRTLILLNLIAAAAMVSGCKSRQVRREAVPDDLTGARNVTINGRELKAKEWETLRQLEAQHGGKELPDGAYWYDRKSGLFGMWGGPAAAIIPAKLRLGGSMKSNCSGGGTGVFVNGRDIHPLEKIYYERLLGHRIDPGRYWLDDKGNAGVEGASVLENILAAAAVLMASSSGGGGGGGGGSPADGWISGHAYANAFSSGEYGGQNGAWSHTADYGGGRITVAGDDSGGGVMVDGKCVTWGW